MERNKSTWDKLRIPTRIRVSSSGHLVHLREVRKGFPYKFFSRRHSSLAHLHPFWRKFEIWQPNLQAKERSQGICFLDSSLIYTQSQYIFYNILTIASLRYLLAFYERRYGQCSAIEG